MMAVHVVVRQPVADAVDFPHFRHRILQQRQQHVDAVEHDPFRADLFLLRLEHGQHAGQVELAGLDDLGRQMRVQEKELVLGQSGQAPIERGGIGDDLAGGFLERDEDAGLLPPAHGVDEGLQGRTRSCPSPGRP